MKQIIAAILLSIQIAPCLGYEQRDYSIDPTVTVNVQYRDAAGRKYIQYQNLRTNEFVNVIIPSQHRNTNSIIENIYRDDYSYGESDSIYGGDLLYE